MTKNTLIKYPIMSVKAFFLTITILCASVIAGWSQCSPDVLAPTIICPANLTINAASGECTATAPALVPVVMDNCPAATSWVSNAPSGNIFPAGATNVTFTATDGAGNTQSCHTTVTVQGQGWYNIVCNDQVQIPADPSGVTTLLPNDMLEGSSSCVPYFISLTGQQPAPTLSIPGTGSFQVSCHVPLPGGGYNTCWGFVVISGTGDCTGDQQAPTMLCPPSVTVNAAIASCSTVVPLSAPTAYDNCPTPIQITSNEPSDKRYYVGTTAVVFTATDAAGNSQTCQTTVQVNQDSQISGAACNDHITLTLGADGFVLVTPEDILAGGPYDCGPAYIGMQGVPFSPVLALGSAGSVVVICQVVMPSGQTNSCWGTVEVIAPCTPDVLPPTCIAPPNLTFTAAGYAALNLNLQDSMQMANLLGSVEVSDYCTANQDLLVFSTYYLLTYPDGSLKEITRSFLAIDASGNTSNAEQKVWIGPQSAAEIHIPAWYYPGDVVKDSIEVQPGGATQLVSAYNDQVFYAACNGELSRVQRLYSVLDWSVTNPTVPSFQFPAFDLDNDGQTGDAYDLILLNNGWWMVQNGQPTQWVAPIAGIYEYVQQIRYNYLDTSSQKITGVVFLDNNENCTAEAGDAPLPQWKVKGIGTPSNEVYEAVTNALGYYEMNICAGDTLVEVSLDVPYIYHPTCATVFPVSLAAGATEQQPIAVRLVDDCPLLSVALATQRIRPCVNGSYRVSYCNLSDQAVANTVVEVTLDSLLTFLGANIPGQALGNQRFRFSLGTLSAGVCGAFDVSFAVDCAAPVGLTHCSSAQIMPDTTCDLLWAGAVLQANGQCEGDSVRLTIENIGSAGMATEQTFVVIEDLIMYMSTPFQLGAGGVMEITVPANGSTWRIETQQEPAYPWGSLVAAFVEGCGGMNNSGAALAFPLTSIDPFNASDCTVSVSSYDPNDKQAVPTGYDAGHIIRPDSDIRYTIRFQNEGTDTAYTVVVLDTLSVHLQADQLARMVASHPFDLDLLDGNVLRFRFDHILLPPKSQNEAASQGFIQFDIAQKAGNVPGDQIHNQAAIYFDINAPVLTNDVVHTIGAPFQVVSVTDPALGAVRVYPQPVQDMAVFNFDKNMDGATFTLYNALGQVVRTEMLSGEIFRFVRSGLSAGSYYYQITGPNSVRSNGKLLLTEVER